MPLDVRNRIMAAIQAFKKPDIIQELYSPEDFDDYTARQNRYALYWGYYENTAYDNIHKWAITYKTQMGLYRYIRNIISAANNICSFEQIHIWGGLLDPDAGDGSEVSSAIPILTENELLRPAISNIWKWSNWQVKKDLQVLYGCVMGDSAIRIVDDTEKQRVYLEVVHPKMIKDFTKDQYGNIKSYILEDYRKDPESPTRTVTYNETATRDEDGLVVFETFKNGQPYAWNGIAPMWKEDYGFIPFVHIPHIDVGNKFGWSELHAGRSKFDELSDIASLLDDHIRKQVSGTFLLSGVQKQDSISGKAGTPTRDNPQPDRERDTYLYAPAGATATSLISDLDISAVNERLEKIGGEIEKNYPELQLDETSEVAALSGRALRIRQQPAANKIQMRRVAYDDSQVAALQMCFTIGAMREYSGFETLPTDGYESGEFDLSIARRPVFALDSIDKLEESALFWQNAALAKTAGIELTAYLRSEGWSDAKISQVTRQNARARTISERRAARERIAASINPPQEDNDETTEENEENGNGG